MSVIAIKYQKSKLSGIISKVLSAVLIVIAITILSLLNNSLLNNILSIVITILSAICYGCSFLIWKNRNDKFQQNKINLSTQLFLITTLILLALSLGYFAYWLIIYEPFAVLCRYGPCEYGPYGWSVALLSSATSVLLLIVSYSALSSSGQKEK